MRSASTSWRGALPLCAMAFLLSACGEPRRYGDVGGAPLPFTVHLEKPFFDGMRNRQWHTSVGAGAAFSSGGGSAFGTGVGISFSSTQVYLLGGDGVAQADIFRQELTWGDNAFQVPLTPGRTLFLTVQAEGGREGWESLGSIVVPKDPGGSLAIALTASGARIQTTPIANPANGNPPATP